MEEKEKELWIKFGQLAWQKEQIALQAQSIIQQQQQMAQKLTQLKIKDKDDE